MLTVYDCIANAHDLRLVALAAVICALASFTAIGLLHHVHGSTGHMRVIWLAVSATSTGFGIWATHFIAMLAFSPGLPTAYNIVLTALSLVSAIVLTGAGLAIAVISKWRAGAWLGGAIVGGGIAAMHYTGMAAFEISGTGRLGPGPGSGIDRVGRADRRRVIAGRFARRRLEVEGPRCLAA